MGALKERNINTYEKFLLISMLIGPGLSYNKVYLYHIFFVINFIFFVLSDKKCLTFLKRDKVIYLYFFYSLFHFIFSYNIKTLYYQIYIFIGISLFITMKKLCKKNMVQVLHIIKKIIYITIPIAFLEIFQMFRWYTSPYDIFSVNPGVFYGNTNNYATLLTIILPFLFFEKNYSKKIILSLIFIFILLKCDSRANNIALVIEILVYIFLIRKKISSVKKIIMLICGSIGIYIARYKIGSLFMALLNLYNSQGTSLDSVGVRKILILNLLDELKKVPVFFMGVGSGNSIFIHMNKGNTNGILSNHSFFLELLVENGIFVFGALFLYYLQLIFKNYKLFKKNGNSLNGGVFISLIGMGIGINSMSGGIYFFPFWILLGFASYMSENNEKD